MMVKLTARWRHGQVEQARVRVIKVIDHCPGMDKNIHRYLFLLMRNTFIYLHIDLPSIDIGNTVII